jgi:hypothetical protein
MQPHHQKIKHKANHQHNSPDQKKIPPRIPLPENPNAERDCEPETCDESLAHAIADDFLRELGVPVQSRGVGDERRAEEEVDDDESAGHWERVGAAHEVGCEVDEFEEEGGEPEGGGAAPEVHIGMWMFVGKWWVWYARK